MSSVTIIGVSSRGIHSIEVKSGSENYGTCPECSKNRRKKKDKCFSYNLSKGVGYCNHCDERFVEYKPYEENIKYIRPVFKDCEVLKDKAVSYFESRGISKSTLDKMGVVGKSVYFPQLEKEDYAICFPFYKNDELINVKYRNARKNFKLESGAELVWYNYDALNKFDEIFVVEGEIDALSFIECGLENVLSVPNGANAKTMAYLDSSINAFDKIKKVIIAVDNDEKGAELKNELIRRIGHDKCFVLGFNECKDANEFLVAKGKSAFIAQAKNLKRPKIEGVFHAEDFSSEIYNLWQNGLQKGKTISVHGVDELISFETKRLLIATGVPSSGKSEFVDFLNIKLNINHGWKIAYWSPENFPLSYHYAKISEKLLGRKFNKFKVDENMYWQVQEYINENFFWVSPNEDLSVDNILDKFRYFVKAYGVKIICIDPFNKLEYKLEKGDNKLDYISKLLDRLIHFAKMNDVLVELIAHPRKLEKQKDGTFPTPTMYDISGSSDFWNKTDYGIALKREQHPETMKFLDKGQLTIQKVKYKHLGSQGVWNWNYNSANGRYEDEVINESIWDNSNWIDKQDYSVDIHVDDEDDFPF